MKRIAMQADLIENLAFVYRFSVYAAPLSSTDIPTNIHWLHGHITANRGTYRQYRVGCSQWIVLGLAFREGGPRHG